VLLILPEGNKYIVCPKFASTWGTTVEPERDD
jgi:hypothetical protein